MVDYQTDFEVQDDILRVRLSGEFPKELLNTTTNLFQPLAEACTNFSCKKVLLDSRELKTDFDAKALFRAGKDAPMLSGIDLRVALLARSDQRDRFFDFVAMKHGSTMKIFTDQDEALDWLNQ